MRTAGAVAVLLAGMAGGAVARDCAVTLVEGVPVQVQVAGGWQPLGPGPLPPGAERIATGPGARAEIGCDDGIVLTVGYGSEVALDSLLGTGRNVILDLIEGIIGIVAPRPTWDAFQVRTPLAIASARSTEWLVEFSDPSGAAVFVRQGVVAVQGPARSVTLVAGEGVTLTAAAPDGPVVRWGAPRRAATGGALGFGWR